MITRKEKAMIEQLSDVERQTIVAILISTVQRTYGDQARARVNAVLAKISGTDKRVFVTNGEAVCLQSEISREH
jgi:citrate lyase gamma subunit